MVPDARLDVVLLFITVDCRFVFFLTLLFVFPLFILPAFLLLFFLIGKL